MAGSALAQSNEVDGGDNYGVSAIAATVTHEITINVPQRLALKMDASDWAIDLGNLSNGSHGCYAMSKAFITASELIGGSDDVTAVFTKFLGDTANHGLDPATSYPAVDLEDDSGYIFCFASTKAEKFSNGGAWKFSATLENAGNTDDTGFGWFGVSDNGLAPEVTNTAGGSVMELSAGPERIKGWLETQVLEGFYFDGTELASKYDLQVTYTLTGDF
jgi:hypothetical protein